MGGIGEINSTPNVNYNNNDSLQQNSAPESLLNGAEKIDQKSSIIVAQRDAFFNGSSLMHSAIHFPSNGKTMSLGNPNSESISKYPYQYKMEVTSDESKRIEENMQKEKDSYGSGIKYPFDYLFMKGNCNDVVLNSLKNAGIKETPKGFINHSFNNNPLAFEEFIESQHKSVDDKTYSGYFGI